MKVLIVDDHALVRDGLGHLLQALDDDTVAVIEAATASDALACAAATPDLDLALVDLNLPDRHGHELVAALVAQCPLLPTVVLAGDLAGQSSGVANSLISIPRVLKGFLHHFFETVNRPARLVTDFREMEYDP